MNEPGVNEREDLLTGTDTGSPSWRLAIACRSFEDLALMVSGKGMVEVIEKGGGPSHGQRASS